MSLEVVASGILGLLMCPSQAVQVLLPTFMIAWGLPRRERFRRRVAVVFVAACAGMCVVTPLAYLYLMNAGTEVLERGYSIGISVVILVACVPAVLSCFDTSVWRALFCVSAGYTIQNIASATDELVLLLLRRVADMDLSESVTIRWNGIELSSITWPSAALSYGIFALVLWAAYVLYIRQVGERGLDEVEDHKMLLMLVFVILAVIAFDVVIKFLDDADENLVALVALRCVHLMVCAFTLFVQFEILYSKVLEAQMAAERQIAAERERQYERSRDNIDAINIKCHDIKHQIRQLADGSGAVVDQAFLASVEREVSVYDSQVKTGNEALDTVLSKKGLACSRAGISISCVADGEALGFMEPAEIYSFFGNALDNAIRAVGELEPGRRTISVVVREALGMVSIHVENYCADPDALEFEDGLPRTTQAGDGHGFGMRSMRHTAERYGGTLTTLVSDGAFQVNALIPGR